jgi:hypothetical protein
MSRFNRRIDDNQHSIVAALRAHGAFVQSLANIGMGCPDLLVGWRGRWLLVEVKDGSRTPSGRRLTPAEAKWHDVAGSHRLRVHVVTSVDEAIEVLREPLTLGLG